MASSSSSTSSKYEVFINFRGEDTRKGFTSHVAAALHRKQIQFFIDDEQLNKGDEISPALSNAIESSDISLIIFSKHYASSKWCLNELVKILDCKNMNGQIVIPVFYHVDPSDVRKQKRKFREAFVEHEQNFKEMQEKVQQWRAKLTEAANISGYDSKDFRNDAELVEKIVADISEKLEDMSDSTDLNGFVGLNSRIENVKSLLCLEMLDVRVVGIWGMGGIGKTTLASVVFDQISKKFQGKCFMSNVREESNKMGVIYVRDKVISKVLGETLNIGTGIIPQNIKKRLQRMKLLIVLDDVHDEFTQLESLAGGLVQFSPGSRIIITTRDKRVLDKCGVNNVYKVKGLEHYQALKLFRRKAFKQNDRFYDLLELSEQVVWYAHGNPLALEVLGASFYQKSKQQWKDKLQNLKLISEPNIYKVLKISYDELNSKEKGIFLDIACFFKGEDVNFVSRIEDDPTSLDTLFGKSLVTISLGKRLQMHDLLQRMGREIVLQESDKKPCERSRLWCHKDVRRVLKKNEGTDKIEGIFLDLSKTKDIHLSSQVFAKMPNLRLLKFYMPTRSGLPIMSSKVHLDQGLECLPKELRYLHWHQYPLKTLPFHFKPKNLIELNLPFSKVEQLWEGEKKAFKLKSIDIGNSQYLFRMWDQSETPNLERINLSKCKNLACVPSSIQSFNSLSMLCLKGCKSLRSFPNKLHFVCQVTIDFSSCVNLREFPKISGNITELDLSKTAIEEVPSSIGCLTELKVLDLRHCTRLKRLSTGICKLKSLLRVELGHCLNLESFPEILEKMELLKGLYLEWTAITELPSSIANLEGLETLSIAGCSKLDKLPNNIGNLKSLNRIYTHGSALSQPPSSIAASNKLKLLIFSGCRSLVSLPQLFLSGLSSLEGLSLANCAFIEIPQDIFCLSLLEYLDLSGNNFESMPASIKHLSRLRRLFLSNCNMLQSLPELPLFLEVLDASNCQRLQSLPDIPSCLEELDASMLDMPSKFPCRSETSSFYEMVSKYSVSSSSFEFINCLKLNETSNNKILADSQLRIQHMAIASLRTFQEKGSDKIYVQKQGYIIFPGSKIPDWFSHQSSGKSITIQLPQHSCSRNLLIGFALCAVIEFKQVSSRGSQYGYTLNFEAISTSYSSSTYYTQSFIDTDYLILGFKSSWGLMPADGNHHTTFSLNFHDYEGCKVKYCGVCPVYTNPNETKPNTFTLKFATSEASASVGISNEEELEPNPKRICRDLINTL